MQFQSNDVRISGPCLLHVHIYISYIFEYWIQWNICRLLGIEKKLIAKSRVVATFVFGAKAECCTNIMLDFAIFGWYSFAKAMMIMMMMTMVAVVFCCVCVLFVALKYCIRKINKMQSYDYGKTCNRILC